MSVTYSFLKNFILATAISVLALTMLTSYAAPTNLQKCTVINSNCENSGNYNGQPYKTCIGKITVTCPAKQNSLYTMAPFLLMVLDNNPNDINNRYHGYVCCKSLEHCGGPEGHGYHWKITSAVTKNGMFNSATCDPQ